MAQEIHRRGAQKEKPSCPPTLPAASVNQSAQGQEYPGQLVHLVEDKEFIFVLRKIELGAREAGSIAFGFQIEIN